MIYIYIIKYEGNVWEGELTVWDNELIIWLTVGNSELGGKNRSMHIIMALERGVITFVGMQIARNHSGTLLCGLLHYVAYITKVL